MSHERHALLADDELSVNHGGGATLSSSSSAATSSSFSATPGAPDRSEHMTKAYENFRSRLDTRYLICEDVTDKRALERKLGMKTDEAITQEQLFCYNTCFALTAPLILPFVCYKVLRTPLEVSENHFALVRDRRGAVERTEIYGPGYYLLSGLFQESLGEYSFSTHYPNGIIESPVGDLKIAIVEQGTVLHIELGGQFLLLPPGVHRITDPVVFRQVVRLDDFVIEVGPETWVTVPEGYDGIAVELGKVRVLKGGLQHHLKHAGVTFSKLVPRTLITDRVCSDIPGYVRALHEQRTAQAGAAPSGRAAPPKFFLTTQTAEGSKVTLDAMVFWRIANTQVAATEAMELLKVVSSTTKSSVHHIEMAPKNIAHLRETVLRIVKNWLTQEVGRVNISGEDSSIASKVQQPQQSLLSSSSSATTTTPTANVVVVTDDPIDGGGSGKLAAGGESALVPSGAFGIFEFLNSRQATLVEKINKELSRYGANVESICVYSATPSDDIQRQLDRQTQARVQAKTEIIEAAVKDQVKREEMKAYETEKLGRAFADQRAVEIAATAEAAAIRVRAEAREDEANRLSSTPLARELAALRETGDAAAKLVSRQGASSFYFGDNPASMLMGLFQGGLGGAKK